MAEGFRASRTGGRRAKVLGSVLPVLFLGYLTLTSGESLPARLVGNRESGYYNVTIRRSVAMKKRVVRIGKSRGIRIPKVLLEQT